MLDGELLRARRDDGSIAGGGRLTEEMRSGQTCDYAFSFSVNGPGTYTLTAGAFPLTEGFFLAAG